MKSIPIPITKHKRALILVDIQHGFLKNWKKSLLVNLTKLFEQESYDLYIEVTFHAEKGSLWEKQTNWTFPYEQSVREVWNLLKNKNVVSIIKKTRSSFKGNKNLVKILKQKRIREVHIVGLDSNDCIFATAQESFDLGFYTYVIEECTGSSSGKNIHENAIALLRHLGLTNH